ncbi:tRNA lysidine(34) synthetase TilS [Acinetobacter rudis]|uniref:tRNA lysidine(34) synthetase TilS n=1 Tax=Acinetobacter rudis TaxID=632955 RepID=UPI00280F69AF|nr:tRNA lysidine(34) synthetase TilS [Acinetobacter rudis]MDQ8952823.1 tRNA lysidine(34) synthetase TilS [Acinetobacter rudis]
MRSTLSTFNEIWQREFRSYCLTQTASFSTEARFLVGCSGGMDSMLLLFLLSEIFPDRIRAIYINHQLQAPSTSWGELVQTFCQKIGVECIVQAVDVQQGNLENQARNARYQAFSQHLSQHEILVLAHHQQDQAETMFLRLLTGTGVKGLAAMQPYESRDQFKLWRPFLKLTREQIAQWVGELQLPFVDDPSNFDLHYDRAWCRAELWPMLQQRYPKMQSALARCSELMHDADQILQEVLQQDWENCGNAQELNLEKLCCLSIARQRQLLSAWMKGEQNYRPALQMVERLQQEVIAAKTDAQAALHSNGYYYVRYQGVIYRLQQQEYLASKQDNDIHDCDLKLELSQKLSLASGQFQIQNTAMGLHPKLLKQNLCLQVRRGGEKIHLHGRIGRWPLKKAVQEAHIFPWQRHTIQILSIDNVMLGVFTPKGFWLSQSEYCEAGGWIPQLIPSHSKFYVERDL